MPTIVSVVIKVARTAGAAPTLSSEPAKGKAIGAGMVKIDPTSEIVAKPITPLVVNSLVNAS